jgi:hypothetical protein
MIDASRSSCRAGLLPAETVLLIDLIVANLLAQTAVLTVSMTPTQTGPQTRVTPSISFTARAEKAQAPAARPVIAFPG